MSFMTVKYSNVRQIVNYDASGDLILAYSSRKNTCRGDSMARLSTARTFSIALCAFSPSAIKYVASNVPVRPMPASQ